MWGTGIALRLKPFSPSNLTCMSLHRNLTGSEHINQSSSPTKPSLAPIPPFLLSRELQVSSHIRPQSSVHFRGAGVQGKHKDKVPL